MSKIATKNKLHSLDVCYITDLTIEVLKVIESAGGIKLLGKTVTRESLIEAYTPLAAIPNAYRALSGAAQQRVFRDIAQGGR